MTNTEHPHDLMFWNLAESDLGLDGVERSTMMGSACLRVDGEFYATVHRKTKQLIVKLPESRVKELIDEGTGSEFKPAGRVFREWLAVNQADRKRWRRLLDEARTFVRG